jgi:hypothetical protein
VTAGTYGLRGTRQPAAAIAMRNAIPPRPSAIGSTIADGGSSRSSSNSDTVTKLPASTNAPASANTAVLVIQARPLSGSAASCQALAARRQTAGATGKM